MKTLIFVALLIVSISAWTPPARPDGEPVPGLMNGVGYGYDVVNEHVRDGATLVVEAGKHKIVYKAESQRGPIIDIDVDSDSVWGPPKTYRNPYTNTKDKYPQTVWVKTLSQSTKDEEFHYVHNYHDVVETKTSTIGVDASFGFGSDKIKGNITAGFSRTQGEITNRSSDYVRSLNIATHVLTYYQMGGYFLKSAFNAPFRAFIEDLQAGYDPLKYDTFIQTFGTHFIMQATFGGRMNFTTYFDTTLTTRHDSTYIEQNLHASVNVEKFKLGGGWNTTDQKTTIDEDFAKNSKTYTQHDGGLIEVLETDPEPYKSWVKTIPYNPALLFDAAILKPVYQLIPDAAVASKIRDHAASYINTGIFKYIDPQHQDPTGPH